MSSRKSPKQTQASGGDATHGPARRTPRGWVIAGAVVIVIGGGLALQSAGVFSSQPGPANVLLITLDTTRADFIGCYDHPVFPLHAETPNIDRLAGEGVRFTRCTTCSPTTLPSHASIMTSLYPYAHGARINGSGRLAAGNVTLAETLRDKGYRTAATIAAFVLNQQFGMDQGFETYHDVVPAATGNPLAAERRGDEVCDDAITLLEEMAEDRFFLWVHFYDPHHPYVSQRHPDVESPEAYADEINFVDEQVGRLIAKLRALGIEDDTIVVVVADHGEGLDQHGELRHTYFLYETTLHAPLIVRWPDGIRTPRTIADNVRTIDVAPTILALLGMEEWEQAQGVSLTPLIDGETESLELAGYAESINAHVEYGVSLLRSWTTQEWKYVLAPKPELYHLPEDPGETSNLIAAQAEVGAGLRQAMYDLISDAPPPPSLEDSSATLDAAAQAQLESLGYAGGRSEMIDEGVPEIERFEPTGKNPADYAKYFRLMARDFPLLQQSGDHAATEAMLRELLDALPEASRFHVHLASTLVDQGRHEEATAAFRRALEVAPTDWDNRRKFATHLMNTGNYAEAKEQFKQVLEHVPDNVDALRDAAQVDAALGNMGAARQLLEVALRVEPRNVSVLFTMGRLYEHGGDLIQALQFYQDALAVHPQYGEARAAVARVERKMGG